MKHWIYILWFICSFRSYAFGRKAYQSDLDEQLIDLIEKNLHPISTDFEESNSDEIAVDPNDRVDVDLWNKLNDKDIQNMPHIDDYSDEATARRWLKWHTRISLRYHQVSHSTPNVLRIILSRFSRWKNC